MGDTCNLNTDACDKPCANLQKYLFSFPSNTRGKSNTRKKKRLYAQVLIFIMMPFVFGLLSACDTQNIGAACKEDLDCYRGLFCDLGAADGYCTMECDKARPCPDRTVCVTLEAESNDGSVIESKRCLQQCGIHKDCRDKYKCTLLPIGQQKVCFPS